MLLTLVLLALPAAGANDPFGEPELAHIYYPRNACESDYVEVQVWNPRDDAWFPHTQHPLVPVETCQLEDPGVLLNAIRWRCAEAELEEDQGWYVGLDIFDPAIVSSCEVGALQTASSDTEIYVARPESGAQMRSESPIAVVEGSVRVDGVEGIDYDVVIAIDRSADGHEPEQRLRAQVDAARHWLRSMAPRLGSLRVAIVSYPDVEPYKPPAARVHAAPTLDQELLERALDNVLARGVAGDPSFLTGLAAALDLLAPVYEPRTRPRARPHIMLGLDGSAPPATATSLRPDFAVRARELAQRAQKAGVRVHLFALAGVSEEPADVARDFIATSLGSIERVSSDALETPFFASAALPMPQGVVIVNPRTQSVTIAEVDARGHFRAEVPVLAGPNPLELVATTSDDAQESLDWLVRFDDSLVQQSRLAAEREHMRETRGKRLDVHAEAEGLGADPWNDGPGAITTE
jgi:hypothetical protein